jgi:hypothetical protein
MANDYCILKHEDFFELQWSRKATIKASQIMVFPSGIAIIEGGQLPVKDAMNGDTVSIFTAIAVIFIHKSYFDF